MMTRDLHTIGNLRFGCLTDLELVRLHILESMIALIVSIYILQNKNIIFFVIT